MAKRTDSDPLLESAPTPRPFDKAKAKGIAGPVELGDDGALVYGGDPADDLAPATAEDPGSS